MVRANWKFGTQKWIIISRSPTLFNEKWQSKLETNRKLKFQIFPREKDRITTLRKIRIIKKSVPLWISDSAEENPCRFKDRFIIHRKILITKQNFPCYANIPLIVTIGKSSLVQKPFVITISFCVAQKSPFKINE